MAGVGLGRSGRRGQRGDLPLTADINITSLVDVAFTLLVIFIITAPILQGGVEVDVPRAEVRPITAADDPFIVTVRRDGQVFLEETPMSVQDFIEAFPQLAAAGTIERVYLRGDSLASYGPVLQVIAAVQGAGVPVGLVGEVPPRGR
ncbi:MAG: biopolymer transporter ExbD [Gemmatimonadetes bacterium]|nr:biopolymer transporter ExbD [Gemmatimonadota bacterium]